MNNSASFDMITDTSILNTKADPYNLPILKLENYLKKCEVFVVSVLNYLIRDNAI